MNVFINIFNNSGLLNIITNLIKEKVEYEEKETICSVEVE